MRTFHSCVDISQKHSFMKHTYANGKEFKQTEIFPEVTLKYSASIKHQVTVAVVYEKSNKSGIYEICQLTDLRLSPTDFHRYIFKCESNWKNLIYSFKIEDSIIGNVGLCY